MNYPHLLLTYAGPVAQVAYPLDEIDTFNAKKEEHSGLMLLVYLSQNVHNDRKGILQSTPFKEILQHKWDQFAFYMFMFMLGYYLIHLTAIALVVIRPTGLMIGDQRGPFIYVCEVFILINSAIYLIREIRDLVTIWKFYFTEEGSRLFYLISTVSSLLFFAAIPLRFLNFPVTSPFTLKSPTTYY